VFIQLLELPCSASDLTTCIPGISRPGSKGTSILVKFFSQNSTTTGYEVAAEWIECRPWASPLFDHRSS